MPINIEYTSQDEKRCYQEKATAGEVRTPFERDRARIIHSAAFRRLQGKTQVFTAGEGDFYRTRLTHSLEVAQIGKGLALRLGADTDLVEAACLVHDIGHPPFGHAGESQLQKIMKPYGGFEANAQNIRLLTERERKSIQYKGLNLTRATIDAQLKYKKPYPVCTDKFVYSEDMDMVRWAGREDAKSFECQIMDWADEVAYAVHDLEDSLHSRYINALTFATSDSRIEKAVIRSAKTFSVTENDVWRIYKNLRDHLLDCNPSLRTERSAYHVKYQREYRKEMTTSLIGQFVTATKQVKTYLANDHSVSQRYWYALDVDQYRRVEVSLIKNIVMNYVIKAPQLGALEAKGKYIIRALFHKFMREEYLLPEDWREELDGEKNKEAKARIICDYISGMTDDYAQNMYAKLFLPHHGSVYEVI